MARGCRVEYIGLGQYRKRFLHHCIDGHLLTRLSSKDLKVSPLSGPLRPPDHARAWSNDLVHVCTRLKFEKASGSPCLTFLLRSDLLTSGMGKRRWETLEEFVMEMHCAVCCTTPVPPAPCSLLPGHMCVHALAQRGHK